MAYCRKGILRRCKLVVGGKNCVIRGGSSLVCGLNRKRKTQGKNKNPATLVAAFVFVLLDTNDGFQLRLLRTTKKLDNLPGGSEVFHGGDEYRRVAAFSLDALAGFAVVFLPADILGD